MTDTRISSADYTNLNVKDQTNETPTDFRRSVNSEQQDTPGTRYFIDWAKWFGYYKNIPELQAVINKKAIWTLGKGYEADKKTTSQLDKIRGFGKDTFNDIMYNLILQYTIGGDSFAEIVKNKRGELINLKPISPASMSILTTNRGIVEKYIQTTTYGRKKQTLEFEPESIFHLAWNRLGDEPHGRSTIEKLEWIIETKNEAQKDLRIVFHRYVKPLMVAQADTDNPEEIAALKIKLDKATELMENMIIPKGSMELERFSIPQYSTLDPLPWIHYLQQMFILAEGVPEVILGYGRDTTEASSKILYLAYQQNIEHNQRFLEAQTKAQLNKDIEFNFPADIAPNMQEDISKERNINNMGEINDGIEKNKSGTKTTRRSSK